MTASNTSGCPHDLAEAAPPWATRILCVASCREGPSAIDELRTRPGTVVEDVTPGSDERPPDGAAVPGPFDCAIVAPAAGTVVDWLRHLAPGAHPYGWVALYQTPAISDEETAAAVSASGLLAYDPDSTATNSDGARWRFLVPRGYDPVAHARSLLKAGNCAWAYRVLERVPAHLLTDSASEAAVEAERQLCLLACDRAAGPEERLHRFYYSWVHFGRAVANDPMLSTAYHCQARFWEQLGDNDMAARLVRSLEYVDPTPVNRAYIDSLAPPASGPRHEDPVDGSGETAWRPRVLMIAPPEPNYGIDLLYDGLCQVLGPTNVVDFPWKPSLHGEAPPRHAHYPCLFDWTGPWLDEEAVLKGLREGEFGLVVFGDVYLNQERNCYQRLCEAAGDLPLVVVDAQDDPMDRAGGVAEYIGAGRVAGCFKREMLACWDYGPGTYPFPFPYADGRVPETPFDSAKDGLFWAGHRESGLRRLYLERVEETLGIETGRRFDQAEYARRLGSALAGLSIFGYGFDTVRYWELPAHGALLIAERPPIRIPWNFEENVSAVFFDDLPDLLDKVRHYLVHPAEAASIARAGHEHLRRYHTSSARARQLLATTFRALTAP